MRSRKYPKNAIRITDYEEYCQIVDRFFAGRFGKSSVIIIGRPGISKTQYVRLVAKSPKYARYTFYTRGNVSPIRTYINCYHNLLDPMNSEVHRMVGEWFADREIYDWFGENIYLFDDLSARTYVLAKSFKDSGDDWKKRIADAYFISKSWQIIQQLENNPRWKRKRNDDRLEEAQRRGADILRSRHMEIRKELQEREQLEMKPARRRKLKRKDVPHDPAEWMKHVNERHGADDGQGNGGVSGDDVHENFCRTQYELVQAEHPDVTVDECWSYDLGNPQTFVVVIAGGDDEFVACCEWDAKSKGIEEYIRREQRNAG